MTIYSAYLPGKSVSSSAVDEFRLVPDAKAPLALIFPPFWLAWHRLWLELLAYLVVIAGIILIGVWQPGPLISYLSLIPGLYLLLEGNEHIRYKLERDGWRYIGVVDAENREEAEIRLVMNSQELVEEPDPKPKKSSLALKPLHGSQGLFPE